MRIRIGKQDLLVEGGTHCLYSGERWTNAQHRHPYFHELCWVIKGSGIFLHDQERIALQTGSCFISELNVLHEIMSPKTEDLELYFVTIRLQKSLREQAIDREAQRIWQRFQEQRLLHTHIADTERYWQLIAVSEEQRRDWLLRSLLLESLNSLSVNCNEHEHDRSNEEDPLTRAMQYIRQHCCAAPSVALIAEAAGLSERQLRRIFQQRLGMGIIDVVNKERLHEASQLLLMNHSIQETARVVGISSPAMFSRLFKQEFKLSPREWRKQHVFTAFE